MMNPHDTMVIAKYQGREVGRIAVTSPNASMYLQELAVHYRELEVEYIEDKDYAMVSCMLTSKR